MSHLASIDKYRYSAAKANPSLLPSNRINPGLSSFFVSWLYSFGLRSENDAKIITFGFAFNFDKYLKAILAGGR